MSLATSVKIMNAMNKPKRYVLAGSFDNACDWVRKNPDIEHEYTLFYGTERNLKEAFKQDDYKGYILPCFKTNPEHDKLFAIHNELMVRTNNIRIGGWNPVKLTKTYQNTWIITDEFTDA